EDFRPARAGPPPCPRGGEFGAIGGSAARRAAPDDSRGELLLKKLICLACLLSAGTADAKDALQPLLAGLKNPTAVYVARDGKVSLGRAGASEKDGGVVGRVEGSKVVPFATGLDRPAGIAARAEWVYVVGIGQIWRIDREGKAAVFVAPKAFP